MKKMIFILSPLILFLSCSKENNLPDEYQYLIGNWTLNNCIVSTDSYDPHYSYTTYDTLLPDSFGYDQAIKIDENSILIYTENTLTQKISNYIDVQVDTICYLNGDTLVNYYFIYMNELGFKRSTTFSFDFKNDVIRMGYHLYDINSGSYFGPNYLFVFRREE